MVAMMKKTLEMDDLGVPPFGCRIFTYQALRNPQLCTLKASDLPGWELWFLGCL
jgi:hypothetical protein